jgi:hypothetical protein
MTKKIVPAFILILFLLFIRTTSGQVQQNMTDILTQKFLKYSEAIPREEIYIHTDREDFIAGEDLWFNLYLIDRKSLTPSLTSGIVYFELLNFENRPLVQKRIFLENGFGPGQIVIPDTLGSGSYTIRAYTSWMKNFLPYNCFMKEIRIYNAFNNKSFKSKSIPGNLNVPDTKQKPLNRGFTIKAGIMNNESLEINITADESYRILNNNRFYLFIQTHGKIDYVGSESVSTENSRVVIPRKALSEGINQITAFNFKGQPVAEIFCYTPLKSTPLKISLPDSCGVRSKVSVGIEITPDQADDLSKSNLSISVGPVTGTNPNMELSDYLVFGSEYGLLPGMMLRGRNLNSLSSESLDSILLNIRSNWLNWNAILAEEMPPVRYNFEKKDHYLYGKLLTRDQKPSFSKEFVLLSTPGKAAVFQYAKTEKDGTFIFKIPIDDDLKDLIIQPDDISVNNKVIIESSFSDQYIKPGLSVDTSGKKLPPYIPGLSVNYQVGKIYGTSSAGNPAERIVPQVIPTRFYGKPEVEIVLADYIKLPVMQEVFFELLPGISMKSRKSSYEVTILDPIDKRFHDRPPLLMVDGVVVHDATIIGNLDPEIVEKIDARKQKYFVGDYLIYGLVNIITFSGNFSAVNLPDYAVRLLYRVVDPVNSFLSPDYSSPEKKNNRIPDMRNTIYWNPSITPGKDGKTTVSFWSSDNDSDYLVNIQGVTSKGKVFSTSRIIKVKQTYEQK